MGYKIIISYGYYTKEYVSYRSGNTFYYNHNSPIGCSTINIKNKNLLNYKKL